MKFHIVAMNDCKLGLQLLALVNFVSCDKVRHPVGDKLSLRCAVQTQLEKYRLACNIDLGIRRLCTSYTC